MGWPPPARSMIDSRRMPIENRPETKKPSPSGPRWRMESAMRRSKLRPLEAGESEDAAHQRCGSVSAAHWRRRLAILPRGAPDRDARRAVFADRSAGHRSAREGQGDAARGVDGDAAAAPAERADTPKCLAARRRRARRRGVACARRPRARRRSGRRARPARSPTPRRSRRPPRCRRRRAGCRRRGRGAGSSCRPSRSRPRGARLRRARRRRPCRRRGRRGGAPTAARARGPPSAPR